MAMLMKLSLVLLVTVLMGIEAKHTLNLHDVSSFLFPQFSKTSGSLPLMNSVLRAVT